MVFTIVHDSGSQYIECDSFSEHLTKNEQGEEEYHLVVGLKNTSQVLKYGKNHKVEGYLMENGKTIKKIYWNVNK